MERINPHPVGSAAYHALDSRFRLDDNREKVVGIYRKRSYADVHALTNAMKEKRTKN